MLHPSVAVGSANITYYIGLNERVRLRCLEGDDNGDHSKYTGQGHRQMKIYIQTRHQ